ncbi:hypothetical protein [Spiroplasma endosymbiont of 'Nebria riversi']|uniref:hypothetical protein n=1 Tax=Spiroplasma endosymbiont of 'Nebria riversi' TaxID=2792084 RepID=UPI001C04A9FC|nr:hypothetical protein [Spiroplasma endosymbiont of 'Nebria riversi']
MQELLLQNEAQAFNKLNPNKDISNIFTPKKSVNKKFTEDSHILVWQPFLGHFLCRLLFSKFNRR